MQMEFSIWTLLGQLAGLVLAVGVIYLALLIPVHLRRMSLRVHEISLCRQLSACRDLQSLGVISADQARDRAGRIRERLDQR